MKFAITAVLLFTTILLFAAITQPTSAAFCTYYRNSDSVTCGSVTCTTASTNSADKLPTGYYYIGEARIHEVHNVRWFNLYPKRQNAKGFWDYHTQVPELGCRGGFGLHEGSISLGCVTVTDMSCFGNLRNEITNNFPVIQFEVYECSGCGLSKCWGGTSTVNRPCTADLQSI